MFTAVRCFSFVLIGALWLMSRPALFGQQIEPALRHYGVDDGLPSSEVYHAMQDSRGFMWFGTDHGVVRFDGTRFRVYTAADGLPDNTVFGSYEAKDGKVWFYTFSGELAWLEGDSIYPAPQNDSLKAITSKYLIVGLTHGRGDSIQVTMRNPPLITLDPKGGFRLNVPESEPPSIIAYPLNASRLAVWGHCIDTLFRGRILREDVQLKQLLRHFQKRTHQVIPLPKQLPYSPSIAAKGAGRGVRLSDGRWALTYADCAMVFDSNRVHSIGNWEGYLPRAIHEDANGRLWIGTSEHGLLRFPHCDLYQTPDTLLPGKAVSWIASDRDGGTWITTLTHGVYYLPNGGIYKIVDNHRWKSIATDSHAVWVGSDFRAIGRYNGHRFTHKQYPVESVRDILIHEDNLWLADYNGLGRIDLRSDKMVGRIENFTTQMVLKRDGGIVGVGISKNELRVWQVDATATTESVDYIRWKFRVLCAAMGPGDTLILGTTHGIHLLDLSTKESWAHASYPVLNSRIEDLAFIGGDTIIAATGSEGVWWLTDQQQVPLDPGAKTLSKSCNALLIHEGYVWVSSNRGVSRISLASGQPGREEVLHINQQQGLLSNEVSQLAVWQDTLWAITPQGISIVPMQSVKPTTDSVPVFLERITVNGQLANLTPEVPLEHSRNNMQFSFIGVAFDQPLRYRYRLLGSDTNWTETGNTSVEYGNLSPGDYRFEVKLARGTGHRVASVGFSIAPPWWNTWWFLTAATVVLVLLVWSGFRYRVRKIKEQEAEKTAINQQLARLESQALRAQMNPHFIFNTMNAIQNYIAHNPRVDAQEYLGQFARLIRKILNLSSREWVTLEEDLAALELYMELEVKRFNGRVHYQLEVDPQLDRSYDRVPPLIIQPLVENAIWHGLNRKTDDGWVSISLHREGQQIRCAVEDNGIGREAARQFGQQQSPEHRSAGLGITRERLNKLTRNTEPIDVVFTDLKDASGNASGTKVEFLIPIQ